MRCVLKYASATGLFLLLSIQAYGQDGTAAPTPAPPAASQLPPVEVIQKKATPAPKTAKKSAPKKKTVSPAAQPPPPPVVETPPIDPNTVYGAQNSGAAAARAANSATPPVNPVSFVPCNLENFSSAATIVTQQTLTEDQPHNINEVFTRVPGVTVMNDDGNAHHGGIGIRGSPPRAHAQDPDDGGRACRQPGAVARSVGALFRAARPHRGVGDPARHRDHARPQQQLRRHQRAQPVAVRFERDGDQLGDGLDLERRRLLRRG